ncbi:MAG TPA: type II toxin-antitoxin system VapB family antitoxin [Propioniciclava tarda]|nr:type II toxin-antitoxin system VapB family antitoxin [Propioniciclava tarda]HQA30100.1 type II toxin-antitoxin system VapB family antitoxin [Propioniciclava tarda]HQD59992.1 type II toxin-antitoxin system VapB family antitoxin [Propioniciclava tarda]
MALNIKDETTDRLARQLAATTGESLTDAIRAAVTERLARENRRQSSSKRASGLGRFIDRGRRRATVDHRSPDDILGYDADGLLT